MSVSDEHSAGEDFPATEDNLEESMEEIYKDQESAEEIIQLKQKLKNALMHLKSSEHQRTLSKRHQIQHDKNVAKSESHNHTICTFCPESHCACTMKCEHYIKFKQAQSTIKKLRYKLNLVQQTIPSASMTFNLSS